MQGCQQLSPVFVSTAWVPRLAPAIACLPVSRAVQLQAWPGHLRRCLAHSLAAGVGSLDGLRLPAQLLLRWQALLRCCCCLLAPLLRSCLWGLAAGVVVECAAVLVPVAAKEGLLPALLKC